MQFDVTMAFDMIGYTIPVCFDNVHVKFDPTQLEQFKKIYNNANFWTTPLYLTEKNFKQ